MICPPTSACTRGILSLLAASSASGSLPLEQCFSDEQCLSGYYLEYIGPVNYCEVCEARDLICCLPSVSVVPALVLRRTGRKPKHP